MAIAAEDGQVAVPVSPSPAVSGAGEEPAPPIWLLGIIAALFVVKLAWIDPATTWLRCVSTADRVCGAQATVAVAFPDAPSLRGYTMASDTVHRGGELPVDLYWQGEPGVTTALTSFVHVRNSQAGRGDEPALRATRSGRRMSMSRRVGC